ncbi:hypothetical protein [Erysipelothrix aquatica]|uniref:hypothetical protein n=1 Tax=Erysipelothrix aquatica TaxID=2683714 RepID=UPI00135B6989|nr:hypothetical protein [Erysipelothrix aquatica]
MSKSLTGELTVRVNNENLPIEVVYSRPVPTRNLKALIKSNFGSKRLVKASWKTNACKADIDKMVNEYITYQNSSKKRDYSKVRDNGKTYQSIQGWMFRVMIDHHLGNTGIKKFADTLMKSFASGENLAYVVFESFEGEKGRYLDFWVSDYEYFDTVKLIVRKRTYTQYRNKLTNAYCKKDDENAVLAFKKGDVINDKNGKPITDEVHFSSRKVQCLDRQISYVYNDLRESVITTYKQLGSSRRPIWQFQRYRIYWFNNAKLNKIYQRINRIQIEIETELNKYAIREMIEVPFDPNTMVGNNYRTHEEVPYRLSAKGKRLKSIFKRYEYAFKQHEFTGLDGTTKKMIKTSLGRNTILDNINELKERFNKDIEAYI